MDTILLSGALLYDHEQMLQLHCPPYAGFIYKIICVSFSGSFLFCATEKLQLGKIWHVKQQRFSAGAVLDLGREGVSLEQLTQKCSGACVSWVGFYSSPPFFSPVLTTLTMLQTTSLGWMHFVAAAVWNRAVPTGTSLLEIEWGAYINRTCLGVRNWLVSWQHFL